MFFRREKPRVPTFDDRLQAVRNAGLTVEKLTNGQVRVVRGSYAVGISDAGEGKVTEGVSGLLIGQEIGALADGGYQKFFVTPSGKKIAAQMQHLKDLHQFDEDIREALGLQSLYNESLGTTTANHLYDRVKDRDHGVPTRPWEKKRA